MTTATPTWSTSDVALYLDVGHTQVYRWVETMGANPGHGPGSRIRLGLGELLTCRAYQLLSTRSGGRFGNRGREVHHAIAQALRTRPARWVLLGPEGADTYDDPAELAEAAMAGGSYLIIDTTFPEMTG